MKGKHSKPRKKKRPLVVVRRIALACLTIVILLFAVCMLTPVRKHLPQPVHSVVVQLPDPLGMEPANSQAAGNLVPNEQELGQEVLNNEELSYLSGTPLFASVGGVQLHVPVRLDDLTEVLFHQGSFPWALHIETTLPDADLEACYDNQGTHREKLPLTGSDTLNGSVLRAERPAEYTGFCDIAADCGATAGDPVLSPVDGTVVLVRPFRLYGEYADYRIHIQPDGHPEVDIELIHIESPCIEAGDRVIGGVTQIGEVRELSQFFTNQLSHFTEGDDPGNHTHLCANDVINPEFNLRVGGAVLDEQGNVIEPARITADTPLDEAYEIAAGG